MRKFKKIEKFLRRRSGVAGILPLYSSRSQTNRKLSYSEEWIHVIPVVIFLSMFLLWWFSCSESMSLHTGGGLTEMTTKRAGVEKPKSSFNVTRVDFASLAKVAKSPYASISRMYPVGNQSAPAPSPSSSPATAPMPANAQNH